jgi:delta-aminolevulinic acid dehydratase/porphobilinogen synthase
MPGNSRLSVDKLVEKGKALFDKGVQSILLFGIPESSDETGDVVCGHTARQSGGNTIPNRQKILTFSIVLTHYLVTILRLSSQQLHI